MNLRPDQPADRQLTARVIERLEKLQLTAVDLGADGQVHLIGQAPEALRRLILSRAFATALMQQTPALLARGDATAPLEILPGLLVAPLAPSRRPQRRGPGHTDVAPPPVVLLPMRELLDQPELLHACANGGSPDSDEGSDPHSLIREIPDASWVEPASLARLSAAIAAIHDDAITMDRQIDEMNDLSSELADTYEELSLLYKLSSHMTVNEPADTFFQHACADLRRVIDVRWMALLTANASEQLGANLANRLYADGQRPEDLERLRTLGHALMAAAPEARWPRIIENARQGDLPILGPDGEPLARQLLVVPIHRDDTALGILFASEKNTRQPLTSVDAKLCGAVAASFGIFIENLKLYDGAQNLFMGTLHALTHAIDAKDSYTHGHSQRVAMMATQLAVATGMETEHTERVHLAGLVHDVGKIGVPEAILTKPGKLTVEEFDAIKQHPEIGARILEGISAMQDLLPGVMFHHERWDGRGYPYGKRGEEIPLLGRIIGIADAFDAMSSNRSYRPSMPHDHVLQEIRDCSGTQFDPYLASVFVELDFQPYFGLIERHHVADRRRSA